MGWMIHKYVHHESEYEDQKYGPKDNVETIYHSA